VDYSAQNKKMRSLLSTVIFLFLAAAFILNLQAPSYIAPSAIFPFYAIAEVLFILSVQLAKKRKVFWLSICLIIILFFSFSHHQRSCPQKLGKTIWESQKLCMHQSISWDRISRLYKNVEKH
jgi:hypothetical protein